MTEFAHSTNSLNAVNHVHYDKTQVSSPEREENKGMALSEIFSVDTQESLEKREDETKTPSFLKKISQFWSSPAGLEPAMISPTKATDSAKVGPISAKPALTAPEIAANPQLDRQIELLTSSDQELDKEVDGLIKTLENHQKAMYKTLEQILAIDTKYLIEINQDKADYLKQGFVQEQNKKRTKEKVLEETQDRLQYDEKLAGRFGTAQTIAGGLAFACTIAVALASSPAVMAALPALGGVIVNGMATTAVIPTALASATSIGGKSYFQVRGRQEKQALEGLEHEQLQIKRLIDDYMRHLNASMDSYIDLQTRLIEAAKIKDKLASLVLQR